jgi:beta-N-acetylhexosaminidase
MSLRCASTGTPAVHELSLDEKIGQLFVPSGTAVFMNESSPAWRRLDHYVHERGVGGVIWFQSSIYEAALLNRRLQARARIPLLISADLESGMGMRFNDVTFWPPAMAVAATGDPSLAERQGRAVAVEARTIGVNHILAPVADVNVDPDNPVINARSYGEDPHEVARFVAAFIRGVQSEGVLATAKHFPGHGDTHVDSHRSLPVLAVSRERMEQVELVPFRAAIEAGVGSVMIGHLAVPSLDPAPAPPRLDGHQENPYVSGSAEATTNATMPATLSRPMIEGVLRHDLGFDGLVVTDAFDMGGVVDHFDAGEAAIRAIEAGEDQILISADIDRAIEGVKQAVQSGRIPESRIDASVRRILAAKSRVVMTVGDPEEIFHVVDSAATRELAAEIARKAITLVRQEEGVLPVRKDARVVELVVSELAEASNPLPEVDRELRRRLATPPQLFFLDSRATEADLGPVAAAAANADVIVVALAVRARSGAGTIAVPLVARQLLDRLASVRARIVAISFGSPYLLRDLPSLRSYFCAYGIQPPLARAAVAALFGEAPITGKLPVTIPGLYPRGHGLVR